MALTVVTLRPNSTVQNGSWTTSGGAAHTVLADNTDATYAQLTARSRIDSQVLRLGFATPTIPAGAKVYSVGLRRRVLTVVAGNPQPVCHHWFRCISGTFPTFTTSTVIDPNRFFFNSVVPTTTAAAYVDESLGTYYTAPDGTAWDPATNLAGFTLDQGRGDDLGGNLRVSEIYLDVTYQQTSTVAVTSPTGTVSTTRPTVTWTYASADSQPQQAYQVAVYTASQVAAGGFSPFVTTPLQYSGWLLGEDLQWTLDHDLSDGSYAVYIQVKSKWAGAGDFLSPVASQTWTRTVAPATPPPTATLSTATFDAINNRVAVTMVPSSASPVTAAFTVFASRDGGITFNPIPSLTYIPATGMTPVLRYDYVAPINVTSQYKVMAYSLPAAVLVGAALFSNTISLLTTGVDWWVKDPSNPLNNSILPMSGSNNGKDANKITRRRIIGTFETLTGQRIVVQGPVYGEQGELKPRFVRNAGGETYYAAYEQLATSGHTLFLQKPNGDQLFMVLGAGSGGQDETLEYHPMAGNPAKIWVRDVTVSYAEVDAPSYY